LYLIAGRSRSFQIRHAARENAKSRIHHLVYAPRKVTMARHAVKRETGRVVNPPSCPTFQKQKLKQVITAASVPWEYPIGMRLPAEPVIQFVLQRVIAKHFFEP
jgi:hypothetical protein